MRTQLTDENFEKEIAGVEKLALVDFYADWCGPCRMLAPVLDKVAEDLKEEIVLLKANLDGLPKTAEKFGVEKIPTVILFRQGKPISGFVGLADEKAIKDWIKNTASGNFDIEAIIEKFDNYAKSNGFRLNPDRKIVEGVVKGLLLNEEKHGKRFCPCRRISGDAEEDAKKICPCAFHKEEIEKDGHCCCNLFVK